jgi:ABC-type transport system substrate-binding protein
MSAVMDRPTSLAVVYLPRLALPECLGARRRHAAVGQALLCGLLQTGALGCAQPQPDAQPAGVLTTITIGLPSQQVNVGPIVQALTRMRLIGTGPDGRPTPGVLQKWSSTTDGRTWNFTLRPDIRQHDGVPVTAEDVAAIIRAETNNEPPTGLLDVERIVAVDPVTLRIELREPSSLLLEALTLIRAVRAGPFTAPGDPPPLSSPTLSASRASTAAPSAIDRVVIRRYDTARAAWSALLRDEIDMLYEVSGEARPFLEQTEGIEVRPFLRPFVITMGLNVRHPVLRRREVRLALNHAVDREELLARDLGGRGLAAASSVWPRHWAADPSVTPYAFDGALAGRLLDAAGLPATSTDGRPSRFRLTCLIPENTPRLQRVALRLQRAYANVGVDLVLESVGPEELEERLGTGQFEAFVWTVMAGYGLNQLHRTWGEHGSSKFINHGYEGAEAAVDRVRRAHTEEQLRSALGTLQRVLHDDAPEVSLVWEETARAVGRRFEVPVSRGSDILSTLALWRPRATRPEAVR